MRYDDDLRTFIAPEIPVPDDVTVVGVEWSIPERRYVVPVELVNQMGETQGYGVAVWENGNTQEEYPDEYPTYRNCRSRVQRTVKEAVSDVEENGGVLSADMLEWYP